MTGGWADEAPGPDEPADPTAASASAILDELAGGKPTDTGAAPESAAASPGPPQDPAGDTIQPMGETIEPTEDAADAMLAEEPAAAAAAADAPPHDSADAPPIPTPDPSPEDNLRVAHILLRMGSPLPARAHLEALAGANALDRQGLLDLAESRWRTGDLPGAGEAAVAYFEHGGGAALAYLIAAEATAATGRPSEAARFARRALEGLSLPLDAVFAGQPRSPIWPTDPADPGQQAGTLFADTGKDPTQGGRIGLTGGARAPVAGSMGGSGASSGGIGVMAEPFAGDPSSAPREGTPERGLWDEPEASDQPAAVGAAEEPASRASERDPEPWHDDRAGATPLGEASPDQAPVDRDGLDPALPDVGVELDGARDDLAAGEDRSAAVRLAVVLRLRPALAPAVLDLIGERPGPDFDLLRGDALRLVGHEAAAQRAFASAASALPEPSDSRRDE